MNLQNYMAGSLNSRESASLHFYGKPKLHSSTINDKYSRALPAKDRGPCFPKERFCKCR